jgi:DNA-binding response OmpR family regulator
MLSSAEMRALLVTTDQLTVGLFSDLFREIGVVVQNYADASNAAMGVGSIRFEALVLDFDKLKNTVSVITSLRESRSSRNALVFAIASDGATRQRALEQGANFALERPLQRDAVKKVLHTAYSLMLRERRRYFRHAASIAVMLRRESGEEVQCTSINISRSGMALNVPGALTPGESTDLTFALPDSEVSLIARGIVVWDDKHGKAGVTFECASLEQQNRLVRWLDRHFYRQVHPVQPFFESTDTGELR